MTPAERIAAEIAAYVQTHTDFLAMTKHDVAYETARLICGDDDVLWAVLGVTLCPKGTRVVLDRTGDTDRLVRQHPAVNVWITNRRQLGLPPLWVDVEDGPDE